MIWLRIWQNPADVSNGLCVGWHQCCEWQKPAHQRWPGCVWSDCWQDSGLKLWWSHGMRDIFCRNISTQVGQLLSSFNTHIWYTCSKEKCSKEKCDLIMQNVSITKPRCLDATEASSCTRPQMAWWVRAKLQLFLPTFYPMIELPHALNKYFTSKISTLWKELDREADHLTYFGIWKMLCGVQISRCLSYKYIYYH